MVVSTFFILDKASRERFFEENFLLADVKSNIVLRMLLLTMSNVNIDFQTRDFQWRSYITRNVFLITKHVQLMGKKEFAAAALNPEHKAFIVYVAARSVDLGDKMHHSKRAQIAHLKADEAPIKVPSEYTNFADIFSPKLAAELLKHMEINDHAIELIDDWQPSYDLIYS